MVKELAGSRSGSAISIQGLPLLGDSILEAGYFSSRSLTSLAAYCTFARELRGQYSILIQDDNQIVAITDWISSYPLLWTQSDGRTHVSSNLCELRQHSRRKISSEALYSFIVHSGFVGEETIFTDIRRLPAATVTIFRQDGTESQSYARWEEYIEPEPISVSEAKQTLIRLATRYYNAISDKKGPLGCFLSSGTDSAIVAGILQQGCPKEFRAFTADYSLRRYSEFTDAMAHAERLGCGTRRVLIGVRDYIEAFRLLNSRLQNAPCTNATSFIFYAMAKQAAKQNISCIATGDHADSLFLGFIEFFRTLDLMLKQSARLSVDEKLAIVVPRPIINHQQREMCEALGLSLKDLTNWLEDSHTRARAEYFEFARRCDIFTLQQLVGQIAAGISWQHNFLPVERATKTHFASIFYDIDMIGFALRLPVGIKVSKAETKPILRSLVREWIESDPAKRASPVPLRIWTLLTGGASIFSHIRQLRGYYAKQYARNIVTLGKSYGHLTNTLALRTWLDAIV
jgi:asparagine synthetase B (glutamine-hydrolysing)